MPAIEFSSAELDAEMRPGRFRSGSPMHLHHAIFAPFLYWVIEFEFVTGDCVP
jgi:hypothetical protein